MIDWADFNGIDKGINREKFVPLKLALPAGIDLTGADIRFDYDGSNPDGIDPLNLGQPLPGKLRL